MRIIVAQASCLQTKARWKLALQNLRNACALKLFTAGARAKWMKVFRMKMSKVTIVIVWIAVVILVAVGVFVVVDRATALILSARNAYVPPAGSFEAGFVAHPILTALHIVPGLVFMVLGPLQFVRGIRARRLAMHRWSGRIFIISSFLVGLSALILAFDIGFGGPSEVSATVTFSGILLFAIGKGFWHIRRREVTQHREWMIRAFAVGLAVSTIRPVVGFLLAISDYSFREVLGSGFWMAFTLHLIAAEVWINRTRPRIRSNMPI